MNQETRAAAFRQLHERPGAFILPNPWNVGTARILASMGFESLATTSTGLAHSLGVRDGAVSRDEVLVHCRTIVSATSLPVSADLEKGFGDTPKDVAATIIEAAMTGLVGCSIEDHTGSAETPIFEFNLAVERIHAACDAKSRLAHDFVLTARCENFLWGRPDIDDTINRLQAFEKAGADVLYAPGLRDLETIRTICAAISKPVNVVIEPLADKIGLAELAETGVKRVSIGSALFLSSMGAFVRGIREMNNNGTFSFASDGIDFSDLESIFSSFETE